MLQLTFSVIRYCSYSYLAFLSLLRFAQAIKKFSSSSSRTLTGHGLTRILKTLSKTPTLSASVSFARKPKFSFTGRYFQNCLYKKGLNIIDDKLGSRVLYNKCFQ